MKRWIPSPGFASQTESGAVLGVSLNDGERVEWVYAILPDGRQIVTGYNILPVLPPVSDKKEKNNKRRNA
jgi:hypothetical protein